MTNEPELRRDTAGWTLMAVVLLMSLLLGALASRSGDRWDPQGPEDGPGTSRSAPRVPAGR